MDDFDDFDDFDETERHEETEDDDYFLAPGIFTRLADDMRQASRLIGWREGRFLVDLYYQVQDLRTISNNRVKAAEEAGEPADVLRWVAKNARAFEDDIKAALGLFAGEYRLGRWLQSICGIGPVLSAGFLTTLDVRNAPTVGHWWRHAGYDPSLVWPSQEKARKLVLEVLGGKKKVTEQTVATCADRLNRRAHQLRKAHEFLNRNKKECPRWTPDNLAKAISVRPFNARLKVLCFKAGDCFVKFQNHPEDNYGKFYVARKAYETRKNEAGDYAGQAERRAGEVGKKTVSYKHYSKGLLSPGHIHSRCRRYAVKMFMAHYHHVAHLDYHGTPPPKPYALEHLGHAHLIPPPLELPAEGRPVADLYAGEHNG